MAFNANDSIQVAIRGRPVDGTPCADFNPALKQVVIRDNEDKQFKFHYVFDPEATQQNIFDTLTKPVLEQFLNGTNACIMAYGQTGSGKTFTMGTGKTNGDEEIRGIIPRLMYELFAGFEEKRGDEYEIMVSFIEVYNNDVFDLLNAEQAKISVREDSTGIKLPELCEKSVNCLHDALKHLENGIDLRRTSSTVGNSTSSRSHAIFTITTELKTPVATKCRLQLVDLAGSEGAETWNLKTVAREGISINKSLLALGNVIKALKEKQNHVPYRGSILTRILQESLGGHSSALLIGCVNPRANSAAETVNTLRFASKACGIEKKPIQNAASRSAIKRNPAKSGSFCKPTPSKSSRLAIPTPEGDFSSPMCNRVLAKIEKRLFSTPNIERFASRIVERTASMAETTLKTETTLNGFSDEPITGSCMLPPVEKTPEHVFAVPECTGRVGRRKMSVLAPETSFCNARRSVRLRKMSLEKENAEMSFDVLCTPNLMSNRTVMACKNSCEILPSPRRGWKIQMNREVQAKNNKEILKVLNSSMDVLKSLPTIGPKTAWVICQWREAHGKFINISDLERVEGLSKTFYKRFVRATLVNHIDI